MKFPEARPAESFGFKHIIYTKKAHRATVVMNRPEVLNCLDFPTLRELHTAFEDVSWDDDIRVMVLTGAGDRAFCTGADLREQQEECFDKPAAYWKWMGAFIDVHERLRNIAGRVDLGHNVDGPAAAALFWQLNRMLRREVGEKRGLPLGVRSEGAGS